MLMMAVEFVDRGGLMVRIRARSDPILSSHFLR